MYVYQTPQAPSPLTTREIQKILQPHYYYYIVKHQEADSPQNTRRPA